jgi:phosphodiesterase/alkaline phosphatase D-like protein
MRRTRRELIAGAAVLGAGMAAVPDVWARRLLDSTARIGPGRFLDSVASGDPGPDAITFWSRLTTDRPRSGARLIVARDEGLRDVVATTVVPTGAAMDHCLKARVGGLQPGNVYWYAWQSGDDVSPVGRTKTANAPGDGERVRLAVSSCQKFDEGFFTGHTHAAAQPLYDLVLFTGDYTYENDRENVRRDPLHSNDLQSYREKLRVYRSDAGLRELHRLHPCAHIWDDHEVENDYTDNAPAPSALQRMAGYRASFEWLPRMAFPRDRYRIYKPLPLGRTVEVLTLDERQYRTGPGSRDRDADIPFLGRPQMDWLKDRLTRSRATWVVLANQHPVFPINGINQTGEQDDEWEGFNRERTELLTHIRDAVEANVVFVTGDIHVFITSELTPEFRPDQFTPGSTQSVAVDYVCGSITSGGIDGDLEPAVRASSPHVKQFDGRVRGYGSLDLTGERLVTEYRAGPVDRPDAEVGVLERFTQQAGQATFEREGDPTVRAADARVARAAARAAGATERARTGALARARRASVAEKQT